MLAALLAVGSLDLRAQSAQSPEYHVKAAFLYHFTQFVEWPLEAFPDAAAPLVIGVLGDDPFGEYLDETMRGEAMRSHPLVVRRYRSVNEIEACHILFISASEARRVEQIAARLQDRAVLTVGDTEDFARENGMIQFVEERGKIRLRINVDAVRAAGLSVSSKLLSLADIVSPSMD